MAKYYPNGMQYFNENAPQRRIDATEPEVWDIAEQEISTASFSYDSGRPITGVFGFEAAYNRMQDAKDNKHRVDREFDDLVYGTLV